MLAIVGSTPDFSLGIIDPIKEMAEIAQRHGCGMHVDSCLGAFVNNHLENRDSSYLKIPGVTSLSADTHKNGLAPKGSSVLVTTNLGGTNLAYYSIYSLPEWSGGVYGTPKDAGSQSCVQAFNALLAMLGTGKEGYRRMARLIHSKTQQLANALDQFEGRIKLVSYPEVNVVALRIDKDWGLEKGATYAFAHEMSKRGIVLSAISNDTVHFCTTLRFCGDPEGIDKFLRATRESLEAVQELNRNLVQKGQKFPGDAGIYCALETAIKPDKKVLSVKDFVLNWLFGKQAAQAAIKAHFMSQMDPYNPILFTGKPLEGVTA